MFLDIDVRLRDHRNIIWEIRHLARKRYRIKLGVKQSRDFMTIDYNLTNLAARTISLVYRLLCSNADRRVRYENVIFEYNLWYTRTTYLDQNRSIKNKYLQTIPPLTTPNCHNDFNNSCIEIRVVGTSHLLSSHN